ncbi:MAG TPA: class I SAM-dependent methyltransferase [Bryobacteraceae bacterium]|nr:class I SAM-dependent methyltransferase [Bryobacteraceae bacterium]
MSSADAMFNVRFCEEMLARHGDNYLGVGWTKDARYAALRYRIMLDVIRPAAAPVDLLDFGCGASHLYEYIVSQGLSNTNYSGLDLSPKFLELSRRKHPDITYYHADLMNAEVTIPEFDYIVLNGLFTYKGPLAYDAMLTYWQTLVERVFRFVRVGLAFNVVSKYVDWERDDLFHLPLETMAAFVTQKLSRHFTIRHDYNLYEYTVYVYKEPVLP